MATSTTQDYTLDKSSLVTYVERPGQRFLLHYGEGFRYEALPVGTRVIYPPPALPSLPDVDGAIEEALENPMGCPPLSAQLKPDMKVTIAFDDISLTLPPMQAPDLRQRIIEKVLEKLAERGVDDIHLIAALGIHRRMKPRELRRILGSSIFNAFFPQRLYNHDAEDKDNVVLLGNTSAGEEVEISRRAAESDLLIYVNLNLSSMDGGHKSINTGLITYRTLRHHHNVHTLMNCQSYMDPEHSALHDSCRRMGSLVEEHINVFKIETSLNSCTFPPILDHLQKPENKWQGWEKAVFHLNRYGLQAMPFPLRHFIFHQLRAPYGLTGIAAGATEPVHQFTLENVFRQQAVPVKGQADVVVAGLPYLSPYNVSSPLNPVLIQCLALGYMFNLYRGKPLVRRGGVLIFMHPLENRFDPIQHLSYQDFYDQVLSQTRDPAEIERVYERSFAENPKYIHLYRHSYAYHGVHPFYMWYWACYGQDYVGRVIVVGAKDKDVARTLGYETAPSLNTALEMAQDTVGRGANVTLFHWPPVFLCDVE
ncbi:MAG: lactate racemase domain-containing protein [Dehalococcoidia bacterium]